MFSVYTFKLLYLWCLDGCQNVVDTQYLLMVKNE